MTDSNASGLTPAFPRQPNSIKKTQRKKKEQDSETKNSVKPTETKGKLNESKNERRLSTEH